MVKPKTLTRCWGLMSLKQNHFISKNIKLELHRRVLKQEIILIFLLITSFVIAYLITIFVIAYLISLFVMKTSFGIKYKGWVKNNLTKHLFCAFLGYHWVQNKSFAHFSIALFMQIMKMNQTQFLNFRPRYLTNFTEKIMCRSIITKVMAKMC